MEEYLSIKNCAKFEQTEKRSKFISYSFAVSSADDVKFHLEKVKEMHPDARHRVYAYNIFKNSEEKYSDDGEPCGTGGLPVMNAIKSYGFKDVMVVVIRYFGGILLGSAGLRKMYGGGAESVLNLSGTAKVFLCSVIEVSLNYSQHNRFAKILPSFEAKVLDLRYEGSVQMSFAVKKKDLQAVIGALSDILKSAENIALLGEKYYSL